MSISTAQLQTMLARLTKAGTPAPTLNPVSLEADLHQQIEQYCRSKGWICFHGSMAHRTHRTIGEPDFIIAADAGRTFFIEAKRRGGKLSPVQAQMKAWAEKLGHKVSVVTTMEEFRIAVDVQNPA